MLDDPHFQFELVDLRRQLRVRSDEVSIHLRLSRRELIHLSLVPPFAFRRGVPGLSQLDGELPRRAFPRALWRRRRRCRRRAPVR